VREATFAIPAPGEPVEVRCHPECPWIGGFVVHDVTPAEGLVLVRRPNHDRPLPAPLALEDVRPLRQAVG
jgi:hypothetical protein